MVAESLVTEMIDEGQQVIDALRAKGFPLTAAFWLHVSQEDGWFLYVASPEFDGSVLNGAYRMYSLVNPVMVGLRIRDSVRLIGASDPITHDALKVYQIYPAGKPIWYRGKQLGRLIIDDAYFYPTRI